jgi:hypothetical protein
LLWRRWKTEAGFWHDPLRPEPNRFTKPHSKLPKGRANGYFESSCEFPLKKHAYHPYKTLIMERKTSPLVYFKNSKGQGQKILSLL